MQKSFLLIFKFLKLNSTWVKVLVPNNGSVHVVKGYNWFNNTVVLLRIDFFKLIPNVKLPKLATPKIELLKEPKKELLYLFGTQGFGVPAGISW